MKIYKRFVILFALLFVLYAVMKITEPEDVDWSLSLRSNDKNPFGTYVFYHSLDSLFPGLDIYSVRTPFYNFFNDIYAAEDSDIVYFAVAPDLKFSKDEAKELFSFIAKGNYAVLSAEDFQGPFFDSLNLHSRQQYFVSLDSSVLNFVNPSLKTVKGYSYKSADIDYDLLGNYFDSLPKKYITSILGIAGKNKHADFIKIAIGKGAVLLHAAPVVFSNAFLLARNNNEYTAKALSCLPSGIKRIYWDNYYTQGNEGASTPFRYMLNNFWLRTGFYLAWILLFFYIFFNGKRRQRIIPVMEPPRNTTYQFINTVSALYYNRKSHKEIAFKKISYWKEYIRTRYHPDEEAGMEKQIDELASRSGADKTVIKEILLAGEQTAHNINDNELMHLFNNIETFYRQAKA